ncbi:MAG: hypothetical protein NTW82_10635 [Bacteroidia bacterium]|nr:hypothetical protein [Bacteroidia bacterium]
MEITFEGGKVVTAHTQGHSIKTDQPVDNGGSNSAPSPYDLFLASIGTCAGVYVKSFCDNCCRFVQGKEDHGKSASFRNNYFRAALSNN